MTVTYMKDGSSKVWDKTPRSYEIKWPDGKKEIWKDITPARNHSKHKREPIVYRARSQRKQKIHTYKVLSISRASD